MAAAESSQLLAAVALAERAAEIVANKHGVAVAATPGALHHREPFAVVAPDVVLNEAAPADVEIPVDVAANPPATLVATRVAPFADVFSDDPGLVPADQPPRVSPLAAPVAAVPTPTTVRLRHRTTGQPGTYACWVFFIFERRAGHVGAPSGLTTHRFAVGRKVVVREVPPAPPAADADDAAAPEGLSAEAPAFTPVALAHAFDFPLPVVGGLRQLPGLADWPSGDPEPTAAMHAYALSVALSPARPETHRERLDALVVLEMCQTAADLRKHDLFHQHLERSGTLRVPGAPENRPMLRYGDRVRLRAPAATPPYDVLGSVAEVREQHVKLALPPGLDPATRFHARFCLDTLPFRVMREAVAAVPEAVLHPAPAPAPAPDDTSTPQSLDWRNPNLNDDQRLAVEAIVARRGAPSPLILVGPAGTGKTVTLAEAVLQVLAADPAARVLLTAPSDPAADVVAAALVAADPDIALRRVNYVKRPIASVKPALLPFCLTRRGTNVFQLPTAAQLAAARVVVATCCTAGLLPRTPEGYSHIIVDEASQAFEPEALVPLQFAGPATHVTLSGDPRQLGAAVRSPEARAFGLGTSLQERLLSLLAEGPSVVRLRNNYRTHAAILETPSRLFYAADGGLRACGDPRVVDSMCDWRELGGSGFPLLFVGVDGQQRHEWDSPSYSNGAEAARVVELVRALLASREVAVGTGDVAVLAPFRRQVLLLRRLLRKAGLGAVNVGSVDDLQGAEARVVFLSPTLTDALPAGGGGGGDSLSFVGDDKRFNVAVTRAQALLVVVGCPGLLAQNRCWRALLEHCVAGGGYRGVACPALGVHFATDEADDFAALEAAAREVPTLGVGAIKAMGRAADEEVAFRVML